MKDALRLTLCLLLSSPLAACGSESAPPRPTQTPTPIEAPAITEPIATSEAPAVAPTPAPSAPPSAVPAPSASAPRRHHGPRLSAAQRRSLADALREGRQLTRAGQHREALVHFEAALAIAPGAWRVECETAFVAWRAEDAAGADAHVHHALASAPPGFVPEGQRVPTAMCLFNAGLIDQAQGRIEQAREVWEESIRLRPNATVSARLAALPPSTFTAPAWQSMPATTPLDALLEAMRDDACETGLAGVAPGSDCSEARLVPHRVSDDPTNMEAYVVDGDFPIREQGRQLYKALVVRAGDVLRVQMLGQSYDPGIGIASTSLEVTAAFEDVLPGGRPELVAHVRDWGGSFDGEVEESGSANHLIVCSTDLGALQCFTVLLSELCVSASDEGEEVEGSCVEASFAEGRATFTRCPSGRSEPFIEGEHDVRMLLQRGDLRWPDVWQPLETVGA